MMRRVIKRQNWRRFAQLAIASAALVIGLPAAAQDNFFGIEFGPVDRSRTSSSSYDLDFVRDWERNPPKGFPTLSKANIEPTKAAIKRYTDIVAQGGWPQVPMLGKGRLEAGMSDSSVILLRRRLLASGDLASDSGAGPHFDLALERAVKRFQASNGLTPTGIVDKRTIPALNVPADARLKQLKVNLGRLQALAGSPPGKRYVLVNIPAAQIEAVENGQIFARYTGVVGKPDRPTPILKSTISQLNFNPVWRLPPTVISKDLIPKGIEMQNKGQDVLEKYKIEAVDGSGRVVDSSKINWAGGQGASYSFRQQPGKENPLGFVKINFANSDSVYMHDTPSESLFGRNFRAASSGCIRVLGIEDLVAWLLNDQGGWSKDRVLAMKELGTRIDVNLKRPVPLHFIYLTAWATEDGIVQFRRDLYQRDGVGDVAAAY